MEEKKVENKKQNVNYSLIISDKEETRKSNLEFHKTILINGNIYMFYGTEEEIAKLIELIQKASTKEENKEQVLSFSCDDTQLESIKENIKKANLNACVEYDKNGNVDVSLYNNVKAEVTIVALNENGAPIFTINTKTKTITKNQNISQAEYELAINNLKINGEELSKIKEYQEQINSPEIMSEDSIKKFSQVSPEFENINNLLKNRKNENINKTPNNNTMLNPLNNNENDKNPELNLNENVEIIINEKNTKTHQELLNQRILKNSQTNGLSNQIYN